MRETAEMLGVSGYVLLHQDDGFPRQSCASSAGC